MDLKSKKKKKKQNENLKLSYIDHITSKSFLHDSIPWIKHQQFWMCFTGFILTNKWKTLT